MDRLNTILKVNNQGIVLESTVPDCFFGCLKQSDALSDHVHINDRIVLLSFLADVREHQTASPISIRMNGCDRTHFMTVRLSCLTVGENSILLGIEADSKEIADIPTNTVSPFAQAAHEMRTPLNAILGFADLLDYVDLQKTDNDKRREYIAMIKKAGQHLLAVVNKTLKDCEPLSQENIQDICIIDNVVSETLELTMPLQGHRNIEVCGLLQPVACCLDTLSFRQICFNLISNAIKYSRDDGHIEIAIAVRHNGYCELTIKDDGIGMDDQHIARLGTPFLRASDVVACKIEGVGLGLAMVFDLVKRAKGQISFESQKGKGTTVKLLLPIAQAASVNPIQNSLASPDTTNGLSNSGYHLTPKTHLRNNGKTTKNPPNSSRKTA